MSETLIAPPARDVDLIVTDKYTGEQIATLEQHTVAQARDAVTAATAATRVAAALPRHERAAILEGTARLLEERAAHVAALIVSEAGKTIRQARKEVARAVNTLRLSAGEAVRNAGEVIPFDSGTAARIGDI